ncbi:hypothetical protein [Streptomyces sp. NRRL B-24720]|nr:hypothetical protein [Streptomyces sp. NRRL B-24720]
MKPHTSGLCLLLSVLAAWCALAPYHVEAPEPRPRPVVSTSINPAPEGP